MGVEIECTDEFLLLFLSTKPTQEKKTLKLVQRGLIWLDFVCNA